MNSPHFERAFREVWLELPREIRDLHEVSDVRRFAGIARVERGRQFIPRLIASLFGFPPAADACPVQVTKTREANGELWERQFDLKRFRSRCAAAPEAGRFRERFGAFLFEVDLDVRNGVVSMPLRRGWFLGIPLPRWTLPESETREFVANKRFNFDVALRAPLSGALIVRYQGYLVPDDQVLE